MDCLDIVHNKNYRLLDRKKFANQREVQGFCDIDVCDIDIWFLSVMPRMIEQYKNKNQGFPTMFLEEFYKNNKDKTNMTFDEFISLSKNESKENIVFKEKAQNYGNTRWNEILDKMIFLFDECDDERCSMQNEYRVEFENNLGDKAIMEKYMAKQMAIDKYKEKCKKEVLKLFVKYFDNLWY